MTHEVPLPPALDLIPSNLFRNFSPCQLPCSLAMFHHVTLLLKALQRLSLSFIMKSLNLCMVSRTLQDLGPCCLPYLISPQWPRWLSAVLPPRRVPLKVFSGDVLSTTAGPLPLPPASVSFSKYLNVFIFFLRSQLKRHPLPQNSLTQLAAQKLPAGLG